MKKHLRDNRNVFQKIEWLRELASQTIGVSNDAALRRMLGRLRRKGKAEFKKYGVLTFTREELVLDQVLKAQEVSPKTAYGWLLLLRRAPQEVLESGHRDEISLNEMFRQCKGVRQKRTPEEEKLAQEILQDIMRLIEVI